MSHNKLKKMSAVVVVTANILSTNLGYSNMTDYAQLEDSKKKITTEQVNKEKNNKILDIQDSLPTDSIDHEKYLEYPIDRVIDTF